MKKSLFTKFDFARRVPSDNNPDGSMYVPDCDSAEVSSNAVDSLLKIVYAIDERTNLPTGDLTYLVSDKANPQVKQYILDNLMMDVSSAADIKVPEGLSEDDILTLSRGSNESNLDYMNRLNDSINKDKYLIDEYKRSVSPKSQDSSVSSE